MKKFKMMALTGILLSSTILGANTTVVNAESTNKALNVDTSSVTSNVIQVINELLNSSSTADKVSSQTKFSDLKDGDSKSVAPIFGKPADEATYVKTLQGELNVVDDNGQLVPMTVSTTDDHGFATVVSYKLDGTTKKINVTYNYAKPTISFNDNQTMNFKAGEDVSGTATDSSSVTVNTLNGADAKGTDNKTSVKGVLADDKKSVTFTPSDNYVTKGITATRTINTYADPVWGDLNNTSNTRTIKAASDLDNVSIIKDANGNLYSVKATYTKPAEDATEVTGITYTATAIDSKGNTVTDAKSGDQITFESTNNTATIDPNTTYATVIYNDVSSKNPVGTAVVKATDGKISASDIKAPEGYLLNGTASDTTVTSDNTATVTVHKDATTTVNYVNVINGESAGTTTLKGNNGAKVVLTGVPSGYELTDQNDTLQTLDADHTAKDIYVKPKASVSLNYTVTYKDKSTGKTVGSAVNGTGDFGTYVSLTAPDGYAFASILDNGFILLKNNQNVTKYVTAADTPYSISYVDQDTGKEVGTQAGKGADGAKVVLKTPDGYAFVNADDVTYQIDKDTPTSTVYVQKSDQTVDNLVSGYPSKGYIKIYDKNGKLNDDVVLSEGSSWIIDKTLTINGSEYYRVATNEYVKASDVYKYVPLQNVAVTNSKTPTAVYNSKGQLIIDRALAENTPWYVDRSATIKGSKMYRVATDEWIKDSDVTLN